jgi:hypothetical protein
MGSHSKQITLLVRLLIRLKLKVEHSEKLYIAALHNGANQSDKYASFPEVFLCITHVGIIIIGP